ncbi:MAG: hypothetical protein ACPG7F_20870, partial [Aggregatilineales bacterium]
RLITRYVEHLETQYADMLPEDSVQYSLESMFPEKSAMSQHDRIITDVLMSAQHRYPKAKKMLTQLFEGLVKSFADDLHKSFPAADKKQCRQVAYAIICMSEMHSSFMWLGMKKHYNSDARKAADALLDTLR